MPFDGRLITSGLQEKLGLYLNKGDTFAQAEAGDNRTLLARVRIPEVAFDQLTPQGEVEVKLLAFPNQPRTGLIRSVQPAIAPAESAERTLETSGDRSVEVQLNSGRFVDVLVELPNQDGVLKPGMTGHAKIEGSTMPVFAAFSRSIVRFIMVEIWSWLP
jgi:multidrug efflux pump subunit AcrA (membrane-fusion protein)